MDKSSSPSNSNNNNRSIDSTTTNNLSQNSNNADNMDVEMGAMSPPSTLPTTPIQCESSTILECNKIKDDNNNSNSDKKSNYNTNTNDNDDSEEESDWSDDGEILRLKAEIASTKANIDKLQGDVIGEQPDEQKQQQQNQGGKLWRSGKYIAHKTTQTLDYLGSWATWLVGADSGAYDYEINAAKRIEEDQISKQQKYPNN